MDKINKIREFEKHHVFILVFLAVSVVFGANVYAFTRAYDSVETISYSNLSTPQVDGELIYPNAKPEEPTPVIEQADQPQKLDGLLPALSQFVDKQTVPFAVVVQDLTHNERIGVNPRTTFVSASLYKLFVSYEVVRQADLGLVNLDSAAGFEADQTSLNDCIYKTLAHSDNPCGRSLRKFIGAANSPINAIADAGFYSTSLVNDYPTTNASDVTLFFEKVYTQSDFSKKFNSVLLQALKAQQVNNRIPQGVPGGVTIAHKTGDLDGYSHDAGIVYSPNADYIITILSGPWPNGYSDAPDHLAKLSKMVYEWFNSTPKPTY